MESDFRDKLIASNKYHFSGDSRLKSVLESNGHRTENAYVLHWTPDQGEDLYTILIDGEYLVTTELDRCDLSVTPIVERSEIKGYIKGLSRMYQVQLAVAKELANA